MNDDMLVYFEETPFVGEYKDEKITIDRGSNGKQNIIYLEKSDELMVEKLGNYHRRK
ncbi:hypothetical protein [Hymenobacter terrestris]|uniref:Uncharacterized protein n=1 Tax=Hymenobacter terrestris TaxID=2748310 RepID=A0ABX2Q218_9BACT|nr:hypothetical protein [Hymenobacter terrestris]NVO84998.1 hypothetical protein [Hymenobacter terrestris]